RVGIVAEVNILPDLVTIVDDEVAVEDDFFVEVEAPPVGPLDDSRVQRIVVLHDGGRIRRALRDVLVEVLADVLLLRKRDVIVMHEGSRSEDRHYVGTEYEDLLVD